MAAKNRYALPVLEKVIVASGIAKLLKAGGGKPEELIKEFKDILARITGQMPQERQARVSLASFSVRKGDVVGLRVTLRKKRMYDFLRRSIALALPRLRDFRGINHKSIDAKGNLTIGIRELAVFPEVSQLPRSSQLGAEITLVPRAKNRKEAVMFYEALGIPFAKR